MLITFNRSLFLILLVLGASIVSPSLQLINKNLNGCFCSLLSALKCENELLQFTVQIDIIRILNEALRDRLSEMEWKEEKAREQESEKRMKELINRHESSQLLIIGKKRKHSVRTCIPYGLYFSEEKNCNFKSMAVRKRENRVSFCDYFALPDTHTRCVCMCASSERVSVSWKINATPICRWGNEKYLEPMWMNDWMWRHENTFFSLVFIQNTRNTKRLNILCYTLTHRWRER